MKYDYIFLHKGENTPPDACSQVKLSIPLCPVNFLTCWKFMGSSAGVTKGELLRCKHFIKPVLLFKDTLGIWVWETEEKDHTLWNTSHL